MKNAIATSNATGSKFEFIYDVFQDGRNTMHSAKVLVNGEWRSASLMVMGEELCGISEWMEGRDRCTLKFTVSPNEDTVRMVEYAKEDAVQYAAEKAAKRQAAINQETFIG